MFKRITSLLLALTMVLSIVPAQAFAAETATVEETVAETIVTEPTEAESVSVTEESEETTAPAETESVAETEPAESSEPETVPEETTSEVLIDVLANSVTASGTCGDNLTWTLDEEGTLIISGTGPMWDYGGSNSVPWDKSGVIKAVIELGVTSIGDRAFNLCYNLTSVTIPNGVTSIGDVAFGGCLNLTSVTIPASVTSIGDLAFSMCSLTSVVIPDGVTSIGEHTFSFCDSLTSVTIPDGVITIGDYGFNSCGSLASVAIPASVTSIGYSAFGYCDSLTGIWVDIENQYYSSDSCGVLFNKDKRTLIRCPGGLSGNYIIPESVIIIEKHAFSGCRNVTSVTISEGVIRIETHAFYECHGLTEVMIPSSVTSIGERAFCCCDSLNGIWVDTANRYYSSDSYGVLFNKNETLLIQCPGGVSGKYVVPDSVISIGERAFLCCYNLTSVTITDSVNNVGEYAFGDCNSLTEIYFAGDAPIIGQYCFDDVTATAYYPEGNPAWTQDVFQNYGGNITWVPYTPGENLPEEKDLFEDFFNNHAITINGSGSAYAYYQAPTFQSIKWKTETTTGTSNTGETGVLRVSLGSFDTPGTYPVTVTVTEVNGVAKNGKLSATVTVTPVVFSQKWKASLDTSVGAEFVEGSKIKIGPIEGEATLGKAGVEAGRGSALSISRTYSENSESLKLISDRKQESGASIGAGLGIKAHTSEFNIIGGSAKVKGSTTINYGIQIDNYSASNSAQQRAVGTYLLGEILLANPNLIFLKDFYNKMTENTYQKAGCTVIDGSGVGSGTELPILRKQAGAEGV